MTQRPCDSVTQQKSEPIYRPFFTKRALYGEQNSIAIMCDHPVDQKTDQISVSLFLPTA